MNIVRRLSANFTKKKELISGDEMAQLPPITNNSTDIVFTEKQMNHIREIFNKFDKDGNESIDSDELENMLESLGINIEHDHDELLSVVDRDNDFAISWNEFMELVRAIYRRGVASAGDVKDSEKLKMDEKEMAEQQIREEEEAEKLRIGAIEKATTDGERKFLLIAVIALYFTTYVDVGMMPVLADEFRDKLSLTEVELGLLPMMYMAGFSIFTFLIAIIATKYGSTGFWVVFWLFGNASSIFCTAFATDFYGLLIARFATGASNCIFGIFMFPLLYAIEPHNPLLWSGIANAMIPLALGTGYVGSGILLQYKSIGYEELFMSLGIIIFVNSVIVLMGYRGFKAIDVAKTIQTVKKPSYKQQLKRLYCNGFNMLIAFIAFCFYFTMSSIQYWIVIYYIDVMGMSQRRAGLISGLFMMLSAFFGSLSSAIIMSKVDGGVHATMILFCVLGLLLGGSLTFVGNVQNPDWIVYVGTIIAISSSTAHLPSINELPIEVLPPQYHDFGSSRLSLIQGIAASVGPAVSGVFVDEFGLKAMFQLVSIPAGMAAIAALIGYKIYPTEEERVREREEILKSWSSLLKHLGKENNSLIACDHNAHVNYRKYFNMALVYTPKVSSTTKASKDNIELHTSSSKAKVVPKQ